MTRTPFILLSALCLVACGQQAAPAPQEEVEQLAQESLHQPLNIEEEESYVAFTAYQGERKRRGGFERFSVHFVADPAKHWDYTSATIALSIETDSLYSSISGLPAYLESEDCFAAEQYPLATFVSDSIAKEGNGQYLITGQFSLKNITRTIEIPARIDQSELHSRFRLNRLEYGICPPEGINPEVEVEVKLMLATEEEE